MIIKQQKDIRFINDCGCIVDENELSSAILWYQKEPTMHIKHIYMHGSYPAVSIHKVKIHVHRLLMLYWNNGFIPPEKQVHHKNGNKMDARRCNLILLNAGEHQSMHKKGKKISDNTREAIIRSNHSRKGCRMKRKRGDITPNMVLELKNLGMSFNKISKLYGLDWSCVKQRYMDAIHDNPELLSIK